MARRIVISVLLFAMSWPPVAAGQEKAKEKSQEVSSPHHEVTMTNMRSMVPSLVALGWDDFFLNRAEQIGLSPDQAEQLFLLGIGYVESARELEERVRKAQLELLDILDRDQVTVRDVEVQLRWVGSLRGEAEVLHFNYLLRAVNVLNHEQHKKLVATLKLPVPSGLPPASNPQLSRPQRDSRPTFSRASLPGDQDRIGPKARRARDEVGRCGLQPTVSVAAMLGYGNGRSAAKRLGKLAENLAKLAQFGSGIDEHQLRRIAAQMQPEFWVLEDTWRTLTPLVSQLPAGQSSQLNERLRTDQLTVGLTKISEELNRTSPDRPAVAREATHIKKLADEWRKSVERVSEALCLAPVSMASLQ